MSRTILSLLASLALAAVAAAGDLAKTTLSIKGMTCGGCVAAVKLQLEKTEGVTAHEVSLERGEADVTYDPAKTDPKEIAGSVLKTGFPATVKGGEADTPASFWMHQPRETDGADQKLCLDPSRSSREVLIRLGVRAEPWRAAARSSSPRRALR